MQPGLGSPSAACPPCTPEPEAAKAEGVCAVSSTSATSHGVVCIILLCIRCCFCF